jgi:hypothetical protein
MSESTLTLDTALYGDIADPNSGNSAEAEFAAEFDSPSVDNFASEYSAETTQAPDTRSPGEDVDHQAELNKSLYGPIKDPNDRSPDQPQQPQLNDYERGKRDIQAQYEARDNEAAMQWVESQHQLRRNQVYQRGINSGLTHEESMAFVADLDAHHAASATVASRQVGRQAFQEGQVQFATRAAETIWNSARSALGEKAAAKLGNLQNYKDTPSLMAEIVRAAREGYHNTAEMKEVLREYDGRLRKHLAGQPDGLSFQQRTKSMSDAQALEYALNMPVEDPNARRPASRY